MQIIFVLGLAVVAILLLRLFGAWMLRIDTVIDNQKKSIENQVKIINQLSKMNNDSQNKDKQ